MDEKRDLYNKWKNPIGKSITKGDKIPDGNYILVVTMFIEDENNRILLQKRSPEKGGKYGFLSGHPKVGESSKGGMITEAYEEMGLNISKDEISLIHTEMTSNKFYDFYYLKKSIDTSGLKLQSEEVEDTCWMTLEEVNKYIKEGKFFEDHIEAYELFKKYRPNEKKGDYLK